MKLNDDLFDQCVEVFAYLLALGHANQYSPDYIQYRIAHHEAFLAFERKNYTLLCFTSYEQLGKELFPDHTKEPEKVMLYGYDGFVAESYLRLAIKNKPATFELLFFALPLTWMAKEYPVYHEMDFSQMQNAYKEKIYYSKLDLVMKRREISTKKLAELTGISISSLRSLRYGYRVLGKTEASVLLQIADALRVRPQTLL